MNNEIKAPASTPDVLQPTLETVSASPNPGNVIQAQPVVDAGNSGPGHWEGDGLDVKFVPDAMEETDR